MKYNPVGWFEISVENIDRAQKFYEYVFQLTLVRQDVPGYKMVWFPMDNNNKGISGALMEGEGYQPGRGGAVIYFTTEDIEATIIRAEEAGGKAFLHKKDIGEYGYIGWIVDTEGNVIGLHTSK